MTYTEQDMQEMKKVAHKEGYIECAKDLVGFTCIIIIVALITIIIF